MTALLVALGAGVGAVLRFVTTSWVDGPRFPWGTWAVNVTGSLVLGLLTGSGVAGAGLALLGVGLCGGLTTYSSFAVQTHDRGPLAGALYAVATLAVALAACGVGYWLGAQA